MSMRLSVNVSLPLIERALNQRYEGTLYEGRIRDWTGGDSEVRVSKKGPISLTGRGTYLNVEIPISIKVQLRQNDPGLLNAIKSIAGISKLDSEIRARFRIHLSLLADWSLNCTIDADFEWLRKPTIGSILPVKISTWIEPAIRKGLNQQAAQIKEGIISQLDLPQSLSSPWKALFLPHNLNESPPLFISGVLEKREAPTSSLLISAEELSIQTDVPVGASLSMDLSTSNEEPPLLPVLVQGERSEETGILPVSWLLKPEDLHHFLPSRSKQTKITMDQESRSIMIHKIGRLQASFRLVPDISPTGHSLTISRVELTKGRIPGLLKSWACRLVRNRLNRQIEEAISLGMSHLKKELRHLPLGSGWVMTVGEVSYRIKAKHFHPEGLHIQGELYGKVGLHLDDL